ncbi:hypothetical protein B6V88_00410 [Legionella micdadei]|nr:hypothetical protein B6V88_00410 [Legionella micdadei]
MSGDSSLRSERQVIFNGAVLDLKKVDDLLPHELQNTPCQYQEIPRYARNDRLFLMGQRYTATEQLLTTLLKL